MKRLLIVIILSGMLLFSCTKSLDNIVILKIKDKDVNSIDDSVETTTVFTDLNGNVVTSESDGETVTTTFSVVDGERVLIINRSSKKIHLSGECSYAKKISESNRLSAPFTELYSYLQDGYELCSYCEKHY